MMPTILTVNSTRRTLAILAALTGLALGVLALTLRATPARASSTQLSIMMDDDRLVYRDDRTRDRTLAVMKAAGVDVVRVTMLWSVVAEGATSTAARRRRFVASNPSSYPSRNWDRYDNLVRAATRLGIGVYFDVTGPGPSWAHSPAPASERANARTWMPKPTEFYRFVTAVGKRYSGRARSRGHQLIPRVHTWALWNEPNQGGWLTPQWAYNRRLHRVIATSPGIYRSLYLYGRQALENTGHGRDFIMAGETAPIGTDGHSARSPIRPKAFIRELMCVDPAGNPYTGVAASARGCSTFDRLGAMRMSAWAHHPYTKLLPPTQTDPNGDSITMANIGDLGRLLDDLAAKTRHVPSGLAIVSSEFGYETNPPDPYVGIPLDRQAEYINVGDFEAWTNPRIAGQTQFLLYDAAPLTHYPRSSRHYWFTYQSGLLFSNGRPKPSLAAYAMPLVAIAGSPDPANGEARYVIWGQLRFRPKPSELLADHVTLEYRAAGANSWQPLGAPVDVTNQQAFFTSVVDIPGPGAVRAHWINPATPGRGDRTSREIRVSG